MKSKICVFAFALLSLMGFSVIVQAASFEYKAEEDKLYIYEITQFDEDVLEDLYIADYELEDLLGEDAEVGAMYCVMITDVDETESGGNDAFAVSGWYWDYYWVGWTDDVSDFEDPDDSDIYEFNDLIVYEDSSDYDEIGPGFFRSIFISNIKFSFIPSPAEDWLDELEFAESFVDVNGLTIEIEYDKDDYTYLEEDYEIHYTWKNNGVFEGFKTFGGGDPMYEISLKSDLLGILTSIPGYEISLLMGFLGVFTVASIIYVKRKSKHY